MDCQFIIEATSRGIVINDDSGMKGITRRLIALVKTTFRRLGESTTISTIMVPSIVSIGNIEYLDDRTIIVPFAAQDPTFDFAENDVIFVSDSGSAILGRLN